MAKTSKQKVAVIIVLGCVLAVVGGKFALEKYRSGIKTNAIPAKAKGNPQAKLKIVEYIDFQCPACAQGTKILGEYFAKYPNQLYVEVKYFPLSGHQHGMVSARYAQCAAKQEKFWPFVDLLMQRQTLWASLHDPLPAFRQIAQQAGLSSFQLERCLKDKYTDEAIMTEKTIGTSMGIQSTPTYFINDKMFVGTKALLEQLPAFFGETTQSSTVSEQPK